MKNTKRISRALIGLLVALPLASCWAPYKFGSEIRITKTDGLLRIVTDAPVLSHNAMSVLPAPMPGYVMYDWKVNSFRQKAPKLSLQLDRQLATTGPGA